MNWELPPHVAEILNRATKEPLISRHERDHAPILDRAAIEGLLPMRDPFLFVDRVTVLDLDSGFIAARYNLARAEGIFAVHFPHHPVWPGVLQMEAVGQTGTILYLTQTQLSGMERVTLTHILAAKFLRSVTPGGDLEMVATVLEDGLFVVIVGQCIQDECICSVTALAGV